MFKLLIESSKDITSLSINFADGTSQVMNNGPIEKNTLEKPKSDEKPSKFEEAKQDLIDTSLYESTKTFENIQKPKIEDINREAKVASELQNLDI